MKAMKNMKKIDLRSYGVVIGLVILCIIVSLMAPSFFTIRNILNLLRQISIVGIIAAGMTLVIISGNFDISVGYICCLAGVVTAKLLNMGVPLLVSMLVVLVVGALTGVCTGFVVSVVRIPSMIATLGMGQVVNGILLMICHGYPQSIDNDVMDFIGKDGILGVPVPVYFFLFSIILVSFVLKKTEFGRHIYAVGGNEEASRLCGIHTKKVVIMLFTLSSMLAALSGIILTARVGTATATAGSGYELDAIAAVVIGGTCVSGGEGSAWKTIIGVMFMGVISNSFNLLQVDVYFQYVLKGLIILIAVGFDCVSRMRVESK